MYKSSNVADRIKDMAKRRDTSVKAMLMELEMSLNTLVHMKNSMPRADTLAKIADYLQCSVDYLLERTEEIPTAGTGQQAPSLPERRQPPATTRGRPYNQSGLQEGPLSFPHFVHIVFHTGRKA